MALWPSSALAQFTYSCMTLFTIVRESSKGLARLIREIYMCRGLMAISRRPPPPSSSSSVAVVCLRRRLPSLTHCTSSTVAICSPPPFSSSPAAIRVICHRHAIVVRHRRLSRSCIVSTGLKILSNICLSPLAPPFHFFIQNADTQFQGNPFSNDQSHSNVLVVSGP